MIDPTILEKPMIQPFEKSQASVPLKQVTTNRLNSLIPC